MSLKKNFKKERKKGKRAVVAATQVVTRMIMIRMHNLLLHLSDCDERPTLNVPYVLCTILLKRKNLICLLLQDRLG